MISGYSYDSQFLSYSIYPFVVTRSFSANSLEELSLSHDTLYTNDEECLSGSDARNFFSGICLFWVPCQYPYWNLPPISSASLPIQEKGSEWEHCMTVI